MRDVRILVGDAALCRGIAGEKRSAFSGEYAVGEST